MHRSTARAAFVFLVILFSTQVFAQEADDPVGEADLVSASFPPLSLDSILTTFPDTEFAALARKVQLGTASMQERRAFYRAADRYAPFQGIPPANWLLQSFNADNRIDPASKLRSSQQPLSDPAPTIYQWTAVGPTGNYDVTPQWGPPGAKTAGRGTAIWTHVGTNKNIIYLGTADGGAWKSTNGGDHWVPLTDFEPSLAIGAIDVLPGTDLSGYEDATVFIGTGEGNFSQPDKDGVGVLKSTDGGANFTIQTLPWQGDVINRPGQHRIRRIRIDTSIPNAQSVWVAGDGGVYRTTNGGSSWSLVTGLPYTSAPANAAYPGGCWTEYATDFVIDRVNQVAGNSTLYAAFGAVSNSSCLSTPAEMSRENNGIYRSTDGGTTWTKITISGANGFTLIPGVVGRITLLDAPSNPKHMYVLISNGDNTASAAFGKSIGIYETTDATATPVIWNLKSTTEFTNGQGWYNLTGSVSPADENRLIVGGLDNYISDDAAANLTKISGWADGADTWAHADHHFGVMVDNNTYYDANDGGINIGTLKGDVASWTNKNGDTLSALQFYGMGQSSTNPYRINAGLQDNGHAYFDGSTWKATYGGDGGFAATSQSNDNNAYEEYVYGAIRYSSDGGATWAQTSCMQNYGACANCSLAAACVPDQHAAFVAYFVLDANNQNVMYVGSNYLYRNTGANTGGVVWTKIPSDLLQSDFIHGSTSSRAYISFIHPAPASVVSGSPALSQTIYVGTSTGRIWRTTDAGTTWADGAAAPLPVVDLVTGRTLTSIDTDPTNSQNVIITYSGWSTSTATPIPGHVFRSTNGGNTWVDISGSLPDEPFNSVAVNPNPGFNNEAYVASDTGVYMNADAWSGNTWTKVNGGTLPNVSVNELQFTNATTPKRLRAVTHGRGIWELNTACSATLLIDKSSYSCTDIVRITLIDEITSATTKTVQVSSNAEAAPENVTLTEFPAHSGRYTGAIQTGGGSAVNGDGHITVYNLDTIHVHYTDSTTCTGNPQTINLTATTNCNACAPPGSTSNGPNISVSSTPVALNVLGGDGDSFLDNCEVATVGFPLQNTGGGPLTNLRVTSAVTSNPNVQITALPAIVSHQLGQCNSTTALFGIRAAGLSPNETLQFQVTVTSDELAAFGVSRTVNLVIPNTEQDVTFQASKTFSFNTDYDGWTVVNGTFNRTTGTAGGPNGGSDVYLESSTLADSACDEIRSPLIKLTPTSTLQLFNQYATEPMSDAWYDRANVGILDPVTGARTTVVPELLPPSRGYLASGPNGTCNTGGQEGWAGPGPGWVESDWTSDDLQTSSFTNTVVQLDVDYGTDASVSGVGFWFDNVTLTNFYLQQPDAQSNVCSVASPGNPANSLRVTKDNGQIRFDWTGPSGCSASSYGLYQGSLASLPTGYDHNTALTCTATNTSFETTMPGSSGAYFLVTGLGATSEGSYGANSASVPRPASLNACIPFQDLSVCQ